MLEACEVMVNEMNDTLKKEYCGRARKVLETQLNSGNVFEATSTWVVSVVRYSAVFLGQSKLQLD